MSEQYAPNSSAKSTKKRSKPAKKPEMSIEEVFASVSAVQASGLNPPPARTVLTPRSAESCLKHGINPEILRIRDLESFYDPNVDPAVQRMRHEAYSQRRHEMMALVRGERKKIVNAEAAAQRGKDGGGGLTPGQIVAQQAKANATFVELEEKRMLKMKKRQEKEIEQMLAFEQKMAHLSEERERKAEQESQKEEKLKRQKMKAAKLAAEERRLKDMRRKALEDAEEEMRQQQQAQTRAKEMALNREREKKEREAKKEARLREEERVRKAEEHREQTQRILDEQQAAVKAQMEQMEQREAERQARLAAEAEEERQRVEAKRAAVEERIARNMKMAAKIEEKRKEDFHAKQEHHEQLRAEHLAAQERDRELQARQMELMEQRRLMVLAQTRRDEERRKDQLRQAFVDEELNVARVREARERHHMLSKEKKGLKVAMKLENVNRIKRIAEYKRLETLRQIHEGDKRIGQMLNRKQEIVESRKLNAVQVKRAKDELVKVMEEAKANGNKASKLIKKFMNGALTDGAATMGGGGGKKKRSQRQSFGKSLPSQGSEPSQLLGPKPSNESLERRYEDDNANPPLPYISPYDQQAGPTTTTVTF